MCQEICPPSLSKVRRTIIGEVEVSSIAFHSSPVMKICGGIFLLISANNGAFSQIEKLQRKAVLSIGRENGGDFAHQVALAPRAGLCASGVEPASRRSGVNSRSFKFRNSPEFISSMLARQIKKPDEITWRLAAPRQTWKLKLIKVKSARFDSEYQIRRKNYCGRLLKDPKLLVTGFRSYQKVIRPVFTRGAEEGLSAQT